MLVVDLELALEHLPKEGVIFGHGLPDLPAYQAVQDQDRLLVQLESGIFVLPSNR